MRWTWPVKIKLALVLAGAVALFSGVGFWAIHRTDPLWPFAVFLSSDKLIAIVLLAGMTAVVAVVAALLLDRDLPHVSWLAVGTGWLGLAFRSPRLANILVLYPLTNGKAEPPLDPESTLSKLYGVFGLEVLVLFAISAMACLLARWLVQMLPRELPEAPAADADNTVCEPRLSGSAVELVSSMIGTALVAVVAYYLFISDSSDRGQVVFAVLGGFFLGGLAAHQVFPTRYPWGLIAAAPVTAVTCYLFSVFFARDRSLLFAFETPLRVGLPLPVDFLGAGLVGSTAAYLLSIRLLALREEALGRESA